MPSFTWEDRRPLFLMIADREPTPADLEESLRMFEQVLARRESFVLVFDVTKVWGLSPELRRRQGEWLRDNDAAMRAYCLGVAFVFRSAIARFVLSSIFLVKSLPAPYTVCDTRDQGLAWAAQVLQKSGRRARISEAPGPATPRPSEREGWRVKR